MYTIAEKFKSVQGEGLFAGTPMAFIRFVGCSVGKQICSHCDTIFEHTIPWQGGGEFEARELLTWVGDYEHVCLTGGEPLDQDLSDLFKWDEQRPHPSGRPRTYHIETSGTKSLLGRVMASPLDVLHPTAPEASLPRLWICVSPKPGFLEESVMLADEVKVIVPGLGTDESLKTLQATARKNGRSWHVLAHDSQRFDWPKLEDALRWADAGKLVFIQPRNGRFEIDRQNLRIVQDILIDHPNLRLSIQLHKSLHVQ